MPRKTRKCVPLPPLRLSLASMRPRPDAAENRRPCSGTPPGRERFNEAAARCRGKPPAYVSVLDDTNELQ